MTAFVLEINEESNTITYSNASHMTPYLIHKMDDGSYGKEGVNPLLENNGARMGQDMKSTYEETKIDFVAGDVVVIFSDGLTEMAVDGKAWGQRNFLKSIFNGCKLNAEELIKSIMSDFNDFKKEATLQDDITLVCVTFNEARIVIDNLEQFKNMTDLTKDSLLISKLSNEENIKDLLGQSKVNHLIGHNTIDLSRELKLVQILEGKPAFNLNDYINDSYKKQTWKLISNKKIPETVKDVGAQFESEFTGAINLDVLRLVSEELLSNSFYHSGGEEVHYVRGQEIILTPDKEVEYMFAANDEYVVVSVKGPSGFSSREKVISCIQRGYEEKTPLVGDNGAGLGLYMIYENCSQFWVINGSADCGQIICVFEKFNRYKKAKERITSFHFLAKEIVI